MDQVDLVPSSLRPGRHFRHFLPEIATKCMLRIYSISSIDAQELHIPGAYKLLHIHSSLTHKWHHVDCRQLFTGHESYPAQLYSQMGGTRVFFKEPATVIAGRHAQCSCTNQYSHSPCQDSETQGRFMRFYTT